LFVSIVSSSINKKLILQYCRDFLHLFLMSVSKYESGFEREYGFLRPVVKEIVERYLDCGNSRCGFARLRCPEAGRFHHPQDAAVLDVS